MEGNTLFKKMEAGHEEKRSSVEIIQQRRSSSSSNITKEYIFSSVPTERPKAHPMQQVQPKRASVDNQGKGRSSSAGRKNRNSLTITSGSEVVTVTELAGKSKSMTEGLGNSQIEKGWEVTRHDLYKEAMYTCAHMLGTPSPERFPATKEEMCHYVNTVFSESRKEQEAVIEHVRNEPFPLTIVNTRVKRAAGLVGSKPNGFVDPYCVVTIETEDSVGQKEWKQFSTKMPTKSELSKLRKKNLRQPPEKRTLQIYEKIPPFIRTTLQRHRNDPKWDQRFQCLALRPSVDKLTVEVWDHSIDDKYVAKAIRNYSEHDNEGETNLDKTLKAIHANADRKKGDVFLGKVSLRVSEMPCEGLDKWFMLTGTAQTKDGEPHGKLRLQIWLVYAYRHGRHFTEVAEPKVILAHFWDWVLKAEKEKYLDPAEWNGSITSSATCFLFQYALQTGISDDTHAIIRWNAYSKHDLNLQAVESVLLDLKDVLRKTSNATNTTTRTSFHSPVPVQKDHTEDEYPVQSQQPEPPPRIKDAQADIEDDIMRMVTTKIIPVIRNHLKENFDTVHEALRSYHEAVEILTRFDKPFLLQKIGWLVESALRMCILEWYQELYTKTVPSRKQANKGLYVGAVVQVMTEVNKLLEVGKAKWDPEFFLTASVEYLPVVYDELQKVALYDVETTCWMFFEFYNDYKRLRSILLSTDESERELCSTFFHLYAQAQKFVAAPSHIFSEGEKSICIDYHRWFRPTLILWLGFAYIRGSTMISRTINIDNHIQDNPTAMTSTSALDTATVFCQLVHFWRSLSWPDVAEGYVIINFLMDVMCSYTILYAELKHAKLEKEGYYDPDGRLTISERLCTALNNIEHVKDYVQSIPTQVEYSEITKLLEEACGKSTDVTSYEENAEERLRLTMQVVDKHIDDILDSVAIRIFKEMSSFVEDSFNSLLVASSDRLEEAIDPMLVYLGDNIDVLYQTLLSHNFHKMLQLMWNLSCRSVQSIAVKFELTDFEEQVVFFKRVIQILPSLQKYFQGEDSGNGLTKDQLNTTDFEEMYSLLKYFTMSTDELIEIYFYTRSQFHMDYKGPKKMGTLRVRVGYWGGKLGVEVISASDITPHDEPHTVFKYFQKMHATSDSMVEVELKPRRSYPNEKKQVTDVKWNNLNPVFEQSFHWKICGDDCIKPYAAVVLTVKDYDLLSKNAFLGEAIIPLHVIPGISMKPEPQPMTVALLEVDKNNQILAVLKSRKWDDIAMEFYEDQINRFVEVVHTGD